VLACQPGQTRQIIVAMKTGRRKLTFALVVFCLYLALWGISIHRAEKEFDTPVQGQVFTDLAFDDFELSGKHFLFRVNSLFRLHTNIGDYDGYEMDVFFKEGKLLIGHDPDDLTGLSFEDMLDQFPSRQQANFWLDLKNLETTNQAAISEYLEQLILRRKLRDRLILESKNVSVLSRMRGKGFYTSYYLPFSKRRLPGEDAAIELAKTLRQYPVDAVSCFGELLPFMEHHFPNVPFLMWWSPPLHSLFYTGWIDERLMRKPQVKVLLTKGWMPL
jgi:hypothetical protein